MAKRKDLSPKFNKLRTAEEEFSMEYQAGVRPFGDSIGGLKAFSQSFIRGYGDAVFGSNDLGIWLGAAEFGDAPFRVNMDGELTATTATITGQIRVFKQTGIPTSVNASDLWVDTDDNNKLYRAAIAGADQITSGEWEAVDDQRAADALLASTNKTLTAVITIGNGNIVLDGGNKRMLISDGTDDRVLIGFDSGGF